MKYLKTFESLSKKDELKLIRKIKNAVVESSEYEEHELEFDTCPFYTELCIIHQKDYIDDFYSDITNLDIKNLSLKDFRIVYNKLLKKSEKIVLNYLEEQPELYAPYLDNYNLDIPDWIKKTKKYNL